MTKVIWKYPIPLVERFNLEMPRDAQILTVQIQNDQPTLWVMADLDRAEDSKRVPEARDIRMFGIAGTGRPFEDEGWAYVATWQYGGYVWHLFERKASG